MPSIIYRKDPKTGHTFAYRSISYRDPNTKRPRSRQEYLGRVDDQTHEILPKGTDGKRNRTSTAKQLQELQAQQVENKKEIEMAHKAIDQLQNKVHKADSFVQVIKTAVQMYEDDDTASLDINTVV